MKTGALLSPKDPRDIPVSAVQNIKLPPDEHFTDISSLPIRNQKNLGACVGFAHATVLDYLNNIKASPRYLYGLSKQIDGYAGEGTFPRTTSGIMNSDGCVTEDILENNASLSHGEYIKVKKDIRGKKNCTQGYAYVNHFDPIELRNAIVQYGLVTATVKVGDWSREYVKPNFPKSSLELANAYHRIVIYGYKGDKIYFINSWGTSWGNGGLGYFKYSEYINDMYELMVYTDIPEEVLKEYKAIQVYKYFSNAEVKGLNTKLCEMLDVAREYAGIPFKINSGFRTKEQNQKVGGVSNSAHLKGLAVDIRASTGADTFKIVEGAIKAGFKRIGINRSKKFVHLDIDETKTSPTIYEYDE